MEAHDEKTLIYRIIEYGMRHEVFTKRELFTHLEIMTDPVAKGYIEKYLMNADFRNVLPNQIIGEINRHNIPDHQDYQHRLLTNAIFQYEDYQEIKLARINATSARNFSIWAIVISCLSLIVAGIQLIVEVAN